MTDAGMQHDKATLSIGDRIAEFPVLHAADGTPSVAAQPWPGAE